MGYAHLARAERYYICQAVKSGTSLRAIAKAIGRSVSTVSRELARNTGARGYRYRQA
ncbi:helix-turn-helix domain-containing protein, partial [Desulfovibrio desulfuricans]|uniref:helix-turn-helix domain-containing protein n=1 Tax=Desulfovibrio desulfuricans TaxID=876 RepID=UPI003969CF36